MSTTTNPTNRDGQPVCPNCQLTMRHVERTNQETATMHHNSVYECTRCGKRRIGG